VWMVPRIPTVRITGRRTCHPCWVSSGRSTAYLSSFLVVASEGNLSLQYVNSNIWTFKLGFGENGGLAMGVVPRMHSISGRSLAGHLQRGRKQEHGRSHDGMVFSGVRSLIFPAFMSVKHLVVGCAISVLAIAWTALLCLLVRRLFMCLFVQHERRCRQLSFCLSGHKLQSGEISCLRTCFLR